MKYSKATSDALHALVHLAVNEAAGPIRVAELAEKQQTSTSYLSKILAQLAKAGMIHSISGANGGYRLAPDTDELSFFDVIQVIEGQGSLFEDPIHGPNCLIYQVMNHAEKQMEAELKNQTIKQIAKKMELK